MVEIDESTAEKWRAAYEAQHAKYGGKTDDEIDQIIDIQVQTRVSDWERRIGAARLQEQVALAHERAAQAKVSVDKLSGGYIELRQIMLEDSVSMPVVASDAEMERLINEGVSNE